MEMNQFSKVTFQYKAQTTLGEQVRVVGNCESLGMWNPLQGADLATSPSSYPFWTTPAPVCLPLNVEVEYKYVRILNGEVSWESIEQNRKMLADHPSLLVEDEENTLISRHIITQSEIPAHLAHSSYDTPDVTIDETRMFSTSDSIILASMNLPVKIFRNPNYDSTNPESEKWLFERSRGLWLPVLYEIALHEGINFLWIGWPGIWIEDEDEQEEVTEILRSRYKCIPLFVPEETMTLHIQFCNGVLFPLFNNIIETAPETIPQYPLELWEAYKNVNSRFADRIMETYTHQRIWIHDHQLLLTPSFVSRRTHEVLNIGIYLHQPFPSSEVYRVLPHREAILHAMLCCDLIGFHLFEYARHFLASCKRLLGVDHQFSRGGYLLLNYYGRHIMIRIGHLGIEPGVISNVLETESYKTQLRELNMQYMGRKVLLGIDPLHRLSGVILKFNAFRQALKNLPQCLNRVVLVQVLTQAKNSSDSEKEQVFSEINQLRDEINKEFGKEIIEVKKEEFGREMRYSYMSMALGVINSCLREGLCLIPFEFIAINKEKPAEIILSEFAGVSRALSSPKRVNPFDLGQLEGEIYYMITNPPDSRTTAKRKRDLAYIVNNTTFKWARNFLTDLKRAHKDTKHFQYVTHGLGDRLKLIALSKNFTNLKTDQLLSAYRESKNRAFFFDNEGTLSNLLKQKDINKNIGPSEKTQNCLDDLVKDERNTVFVITGRERRILEKWYGKISNLGMAAEYGSFIRWNSKSQWQLMTQGSSNWKETAKQIISAYVTRTEGSYIEEKECSVVFQYRDTDPDLGSWQAKELISHLEILLKPFMNECEVSSGLGYVEVKPSGITKGTTLYRILEQISEKKGPLDFVLAIGDDIADEEMFRVVKAIRKEKSSIISDKKAFKSFTCTVGRKPSLADYYVNDANEIVQFLELLRGWSNKSKKNFSYGDLSSLQLRHPTFSLHPIGVFGPRSRAEIVQESSNSESEDEETISSPRAIYKPKKKSYTRKEYSSINLFSK